MAAPRSLLVALCAAACLHVPAAAQAATASFPGESLTASDQNQAGRLNQTGPSNCSTPKAAPVVNGDPGSREVDMFIFRNTNTSPLCVTVTIDTACSGASAIHSTAYRGTDVPNDLRTGYLGDRGGQGPSYSFVAPANDAFTVAVAEGSAGGGCGAYGLTVGLPFADNVAEIDDGIAAAEPTQTGFVYRSAMQRSTCAGPSPAPERLQAEAQYRYDAFTYTNTGTAPTCVTATVVARGCGPSAQVQSAAYLDSFDPAKVLTNYLAHQPSASIEQNVVPYAFMVPGGRKFVVVVHDRQVNMQCPAYHLSVDGKGVVSGTPPVGPGPGPGPGPGGGDTTAPVWESARLSNPTFAVDRKGQPEVAIARAPKGTTFVYRLSEAARVEFAIHARRKGRKVGERCRKPSSRNRKRKRCTRFVHQGTFAHDSLAGTTTKKFSGKIGDKTLKPGRYRATLTAIDPAANTSKVKRLSFKVVRR